MQLIIPNVVKDDLKLAEPIVANKRPPQNKNSFAALVTRYVDEGSEEKSKDNLIIRPRVPKSEERTESTSAEQLAMAVSVQLASKGELLYAESGQQTGSEISAENPILPAAIETPPPKSQAEPIEAWLELDNVAEEVIAQQTDEIFAELPVQELEKELAAGESSSLPKKKLDTSVVKVNEDTSETLPSTTIRAVPAESEVLIQTASEEIKEPVVASELSKVAAEMDEFKLPLTKAANEVKVKSAQEPPGQLGLASPNLDEAVSTEKGLLEPEMASTESELELVAEDIHLVRQEAKISVAGAEGFENLQVVERFEQAQLEPEPLDEESFEFKVEEAAAQEEQIVTRQASEKEPVKNVAFKESRDKLPPRLQTSVKEEQQTSPIAEFTSTEPLIDEVADLDVPSRPVVDLQDAKPITKIVEQIQTSVQEERTEVRIQLKPDHLGELKIRLSVERGIMMAEFVVENEAVREVIASQLPQLHTALQEQGANVGEMMVNIGFNQERQDEQTFARNRQTPQTRTTGQSQRIVQATRLQPKSNPWNHVDLRA